MKTATIQHHTKDEKTLRPSNFTKLYPPLDLETRTAIPTAAAAYHLSRKDQTLRVWACLENGPIRPIRINGRLAWPVFAIRALLEKGDAQ